MKTSIHTLYDYHDYPLEKTVVISCPQEYIDREFLHVVRPFKKMISIQTVQQGDVTMLKLVSDLPRYQKPMIPVTVGGNLFSKELEAQLPGHMVGESFDAAVDGGTVSVTILKATRTEFPSPTDEYEKVIRNRTCCDYGYVHGRLHQPA